MGWAAGSQGNGRDGDRATERRNGIGCCVTPERLGRCGGSRAWTSLGGVGLCTCMTVHHDRLGVLGILRVGVGGIGEGGVRERGVLH
jgi:hypothetical protein